MNISLRQIRAFVAVAESGRFSLAAAHMHLTQSALSMMVKQLEGEMGARLFDRHTRMVQITEAGRAFLPVARKTLADLETALAVSRDAAALKHGRVTVATNAVIGATLLPWAMRQFALLHPGIRVILKDVAEEDIYARVRERDVDLGLGTVLDAEDDLDQIPLFRDRLTLLCAHNHPLAAKRRISWRALKGYPFIALAKGSPIRALADRALRHAGLQLAPAFEVSFSSTAISLAAVGLGVTALPINARQLSPKVNVVARDLILPVTQRQVALIQLREVDATPASKSFSAFLREYFARGGNSNALDAAY